MRMEAVMKKRICLLGMSLLVMMVCFLFRVIPARADVIWEPQDSFYEEHSSECNYVNRLYTADGPDGVVIVYESPESDKAVATWENGKAVWISYTYEDERGVLWGISEAEENGWMPMDYMKLVYDSISFEEDYSDQIEAQSGELEEQYRNDTIYLWKYPASEQYSMVDLQSLGAEYMPQYDGLYTDETGHQWGKIGYFYGMRSMWVCLDAPTADYAALYPGGAPQIVEQEHSEDAVEQNPETEQSQTPEGKGTERIEPQNGQAGGRMVVMVVVLVGMVVLVTAVLLFVLKKRGGRKIED